jgi:CHASE2 domain-containing sensor protein
MKHIHKKIGRQVKKLPSHFTKYLFERDTIFATIWVFIFIVGLGSIPLNLGSLNPIKLSLKDFDFTDVSYSNLGKAQLKEGKNNKFDNRIVIVNIGNADREGLAMMIDKASHMNPKVMALDVLFFGEKDPYQDSLLSEVFKRNKNLIVAQRLVLSGPDGDTIVTDGDYINTASTYAYVNLFADSLSSIRYYEPFEKDYKKKLYKSFSSAIVQAYDSAAYKELRKKGNSKTFINYSRSLIQYQPVQWEDLMMDNIDSSVLSGKIVLFGYLGTETDGIADKDDLSDKFFTPMNPRYYGKSVPDMHGILIHANIISMVLDDNYVKKLPLWANLLIAVLICWLFMSFFIRYYLESHIWFHLVAKIAQVASAIFFVWLGIYLFDQYRLKVDMKMSLIVIVLAVDVIYFYEAWAVWMHKKFHYHTVFKPHHH